MTLNGMDEIEEATVVDREIWVEQDGYDEVTAASRRPLLLELDGIEATDIQRAGAKAAALARWSRAGFRVPAGLVLSADAHREAGNGEDALGPALPDAVECALRARLPALLQEGPVAVRASRTRGPGLGERSAGDATTVLNVVGLEDCLAAIEACWSSEGGGSPRPASEEDPGWRAAAPATAVLVQRMAEAEVSGQAGMVIDGPGTQVWIDAHWGLGPRGEGEFDRMRVALPDGELVTSRVAVKRREIIAATQGVLERPVETERAEARCLDGTRLRLVAEMCAELSRRAGLPLQIAWCFAAGELQLLGARPLGRLSRRWERASTDRRFPEQLTPLSWDLLDEAFDSSVRWSLEWMGLPPLAGRWLRYVDGWVEHDAVVDRVYTEAIELRFEKLEELRGQLESLRRRYAWVSDLPLHWLGELDGFLMALGRLSRVDPAELPDDELIEHLGRLRDLGRSWFRPRLALSLGRRLLERLVEDLATAAAGPERGPRLAGELCCAVEGRTLHLEIERFVLYGLASRQEDLAALLRAADVESLWKGNRLAAWPDFRARLERFAADHGHHATPAELSRPCHAEQPWRALEPVARMLAEEQAGRRPMAPECRLRLLRVRQGQAEARLNSLLPGWLQAFAGEVLRLRREFELLDDLERYQTARLALPLRGALLEIGGRLACRELLSAPDRVFLLRREEMEDRLLS